MVDFGWPAAVLCFAARLYELVRAHLVVRVKFALRQLVDDSLRNRVRVCSNAMIQCVSKGGQIRRNGFAHFLRFLLLWHWQHRQQVMDTIEPCPSFIVALDHVPGAVLRVRAAKCLFFRNGVVFPANTSPDALRQCCFCQRMQTSATASSQPPAASRQLRYDANGLQAQLNYMLVAHCKSILESFHRLSGSCIRS